MGIRRFGERPANISKRIKDLREKAGMTASELARRTAVTPTAVWNWETNNRVPRSPTFEAVARVLGVTPYFLRTGENTEPHFAPTRASDARPEEDVGSILEDAKRRLATVMRVGAERVKVTFVVE